MLCSKPFRKNGDEYGCGHCLQCLSVRRQVWTIRLMLEARLHLANCWVTLTYSDEYLPPGSNLSHSHVRDLIKRLRHHVDLRYYYVGEYGTTYGRPHYHVIFFGFDNIQLISDNWSYGHVHGGPVNMATISYTVGDILKGDKSGSARSDGRVPEFYRMSRNPGIGALAAEIIFNAVRVSGEVPLVATLNGVKLPLGRYLRGLIREFFTGSRIESDSERDSRRIAFRAQFPDYASLQLREVKRKNGARIIKQRTSINAQRKRLKL